MLPPEIFTVVFSYLPVKSLLRFRCVSRSWCSIIDGHDFVKMHLQQSVTTNSNHNLILGGLGLCYVNLDSLDRAHAIIPQFYYKSDDIISNSCNGLVLVMGQSPVLWNPFTRKYRFLPAVRMDYQIDPECFSKIYNGLGYDSKKDDYKIVQVVEFRNKMNHEWVYSETEIYSLKLNSWKRIEGFPYPVPFLKGNWGLHINGALHTLVEDFLNLLSDSVKIMAFSVENEKHYEVTMPSDIRIKNANVKLDALGGSLCLICARRSRVDIWVMKEYGVNESWIKLLSIGPPMIDPVYVLKPLAYSKNGEKVLLDCDDKRLIWYDLRDKTTEYVSVKRLPFVFYPEICVESLVSPCGLEESDGINKQHGRGKGKEKKIKRNRVRDDFLSEGFKLVL